MVFHNSVSPKAIHLLPQAKWFQNGSMDITIKRVPDKVYQTIKREAKKQGRSLNAQIIQTLETQATQLDRRKQFDKARAELEEFVASQKPMDSSAPIIRQERMKR
jgi:hypothetical protein